MIFKSLLKTKSTLPTFILICFITWTAIWNTYLDGWQHTAHPRGLGRSKRKMFDGGGKALREENENFQAKNPNISEFREDYGLTRFKDIYQTGFEEAQEHLCSKKDSLMQLLILVASAPSHSKIRMAIRNTWGRLKERRDVVVAFMIGSQSDPAVRDLIHQENSLFNDVIINRNNDTYRNLPLKTMSILEWSKNFCSNVPYVLKTDDDVFINLPKLFEFIGNIHGSSKVIYGNLAEKWGVNRDKNSKYYVNIREFRGNKLPNFVTGPAYLMSANVPLLLYKASLNFTFLPLEDVFFTGVVAQQAGIRRVAAPEFANAQMSKRDTCALRKAISFHKVQFLHQFYYLAMLMKRHTKCQ